MYCSGTVDTFSQAVKNKPGGCIGSVNYLGSGELLKSPVEWASVWGIKESMAATPGGRNRMEKLVSWCRRENMTK